MAEPSNLDLTARRRRLFFMIVGAAVLATIVGVALLMNIFERKQEARNPFYRVVELTDERCELEFIDYFESVRRTMFLPFVSEGKQSGIGLGLTLAQRIAQEHGQFGRGARCCFIRHQHEIPVPGQYES